MSWAMFRNLLYKPNRVQVCSSVKRLNLLLANRLAIPTARDFQRLY